MISMIMAKLNCAYHQHNALWNDIYMWSLRFVARAAWTSKQMSRHYITYHSRHPGWYSKFPGHPGQCLYFPRCGPGCAKWIPKVTIFKTNGYKLVKPCFYLCYSISSQLLPVSVVNSYHPWVFGPRVIRMTPQLYPVTQEGFNLYLLIRVAMYIL